MQKERFDITGMTCSACSAGIEKSVAKLPGIKEVSVNLLKNSMAASVRSVYHSTVLYIYGAYDKEKEIRRLQEKVRKEET